jgi:hypothetical protein
MKPEWIALVFNVCIFSYYAWQWQEPGKILYWLGACFLTIGLLFMRG